MIRKTVERSSLRSGQTAIATRTNSSGRLTYLVEASDDDLLVKENALAAKARRNCLLALLPSDIRDECLERIAETRRGETVRQPAQAAGRIVAAFAALDIGEVELARYIGKPLADAAVEDIDALRNAFAAVRDGEATWRDLLSAVVAERAPAAHGRGAGVASARERVAEQAAASRSRPPGVRAAQAAIESEDDVDDSQAAEADDIPQ